MKCHTQMARVPVSSSRSRGVVAVSGLVSLVMTHARSDQSFRTARPLVQRNTSNVFVVDIARKLVVAVVPSSVVEVSHRLLDSCRTCKRIVGDANLKREVLNNETGGNQVLSCW